MRICSLLVCLVAVVAVAPLSAQSCLGLPNAFPVNARLGITPDEGATRLSGRVGAFLKQAFVGVSGDYQNVPFANGSVRAVGVDLGYQIALNEKKTVHFCPMLGASYSQATLNVRSVFGEFPFGQDPLGAFRIDGRSLMAGAGIGGAIPISPTVDLVPFANLGLLRVREGLKEPLMFLDPYVEDATRDESRTLGVLGVGLGLQFSQRYTVTVAIAQRVSVSSGSSSHMMLGGAMGFGKR